MTERRQALVPVRSVEAIGYRAASTGVGRGGLIPPDSSHHMTATMTDSSARSDQQPSSRVPSSPSDADAHWALLPTGFHDGLPPYAAREAEVVDGLMARIGSHGYDRVKPPLCEFETSLLAGAGQALASETFRVMDPASQRMMGLRADMTTQIARLAASRLRTAPRPLRLAYAGQVLRVTGGQIRPERQIAQVGAELIGATGPAADAEVAAVALTALEKVGVAGLSLDLTVPTLVPKILDAHDSGDRDALMAALDRKDAAEVRAVGTPVARLLHALLRAEGAADPALAAARALSLPDSVASDLAELADIVARLRILAPGTTLTVDFVEHRGFRYHTGVTFSIFARRGRGELGRGGRYITTAPTGHEGEPATGVTLYLDSILHTIPATSPPRRVYAPYGSDPGVVTSLRNAGRVVVSGLAPETDPAEEGRRLGCADVMIGGDVRPIE